MMTLNYFWWLYRDMLIYWMGKGLPSLQAQNVEGIRYTGDFLVELEESIANKLERMEKNE